MKLLKLAIIAGCAISCATLEAASKTRTFVKNAAARHVLRKGAARRHRVAKKSRAALIALHARHAPHNRGMRTAVIGAARATARRAAGRGKRVAPRNHHNKRQNPSVNVRRTNAPSRNTQPGKGAVAAQPKTAVPTVVKQPVPHKNPALPMPHPVVDNVQPVIIPANPTVVPTNQLVDRVQPAVTPATPIVVPADPFADTTGVILDERTTNVRQNTRVTFKDTPAPVRPAVCEVEAELREAIEEAIRESEADQRENPSQSQPSLQPKPSLNDAQLRLASDDDQQPQDDRVRKACPICLEKKDLEKLSCKDTCCAACIGDMASVAANNNSTEFLKCPTCRTAIPQNDIDRITQGKNKAALNAISEREAEQKIASMEGMKQCPTPNCTFIFENSANRAQNFNCPACHQQYCSACLIKHNPESSSCEAVKRQMDGANEAWKNNNTKACPSCRKRIEKNGGCPRVSCPCGTTFCWECRESVDTCIHYAH